MRATAMRIIGKNARLTGAAQQADKCDGDACGRPRDAGSTQPEQLPKEPEEEMMQRSSAGAAACESNANKPDKSEQKN